MTLTFRFLPLLLLLTLPLFAIGPAYEERIVEDVKILFEENSAEASLNTAPLLARLKTRRGQLFSQTAFDEDLKSLSTDYARVDPVLTPVGDKLLITITLWPRPVIHRIYWKGNEKLTKSVLEKELGIYAGSIFDRAEFATAFNGIKAKYVKKGYFEAKTQYRVERDIERNTVTIYIDIDEGRSGRIRKVEFVNFTKKEENEISKRLLTKEYDLFKAWLTGTGVYREEMARQDELQILDFLHNQGYADARVSISVRETKSNGLIVVTITAEKGVQYRVGEISISGNTLFETATLETLLQVKAGDTFSPQKLRDSVGSITDFYGARGYIDAYANFEPHLDEDEPVYDVDITVREGRQYYVGMINVLGNHSTRTSVILHETLLVPGEVFNIHKLKQTESRLMAIGYFKNVNVYAVNPTDEGYGSEYRDVIIEVEEDSTGNFSAFFGFSTSENVFGGASITERNFNYRGLGRLFSEGYSAMRGGGEYAHITATIGKQHRNYVLSWTKPFFCDTPWVVGVDIERSTNQLTSDNYTIDAMGLKLHAKYPINQFVKFGVHYRFRNSDVEMREFDQTANTPEKLEEIRRYTRNAGEISAAGVSLSYDSTNSLSRPTSGFRSRLEAEYAGLGGNYEFSSFGYLNTLYLPVTCNGTLRFRGDIRMLFPYNSWVDGTPIRYDARIPMDERFFLGGETSVRGYRAYSIGPKITIKHGEKDKQNNYRESELPIGGVSQTVLSAEYNHYLSDMADVFFFVDGGSVSGKAGTLGSMYWSYGVGTRLSLLGNGPPLMIGYGWPVNADSHSDEKNFFLSIGGRF